MGLRVLVTGTSQGIGLEFVAQLAANDSVETIYAGVRTLTEVSAELQTLTSNSKIKLVVIDARSPTDAKDAAASISLDSPRLDLVIANTGIANTQLVRLEHVDPDQILDHTMVNAAGTVRLFQAMLPLLRNTTEPNPKFVAISSGAGSITDLLTFPMSAYGASKAQLNYFLREAHYEHRHEHLIVLPMLPGLVDTDMATDTAKGILKLTSKHDSVQGMLRVIFSATEDMSGLPWTFEGVQTRY